MTTLQHRNYKTYHGGINIRLRGKIY